MFDANARWLPQGTKFFGKAHNVEKHTTMFKRGLRNNMIVECIMRDKGHRNPVIIMIINDEPLFVNSFHDDEYSWIVYEGSYNEDGEVRDLSFIDDESRAKAKAIVALKSQK